MKKLFITIVFLCGISLTIFAQEKTAKDLKVEALEAFKAKDYQKGFDGFSQAIKMYESEGKIDTSLYFNAGVCAFKVEQYDKCIPYFDRSMELGYKTCIALLYKANALKKLEKNTELEQVCNQGMSTCKENADKFKDLLFQYYLMSGLDIFNKAAKMQADVTPLATSDAEKYKAEMVKVKAEFTKSLPMLEKAHEIIPTDENCKKALKQAYELLEMKDKAAAL
jgi:tetratricopeptide (TPR) repeat protein